jgi:hypothetical protein
MEWISVKDRLPEESEAMNQNYVLAYFDWGRPARIVPLKIQFAEISCGHWRPMGGNGNFDKEVTHWMPLPEAPK